MTVSPYRAVAPVSAVCAAFRTQPSAYPPEATKPDVAPPSNPMGIRIDSKRRKKLMQKRLAMGHKQDDHEQNHGQTLQ